MTDRRAFLQSLVSLPMIGGGVSLIGNPTASAVQVTPRLLDAYDQWLFYERCHLQFHHRPWSHPFDRAQFDAIRRERVMDALTDKVSGTRPKWFDHTGAASRAAVILSAAGVPVGGGALG